MEGGRLVSVDREERNQRAFEAWLVRKQEERKVPCYHNLNNVTPSAMQQYQRDQQQAQKAANMQRISEEKKMMSTRAYQQWLLRKHEEEQLRKKEQMVEQQFEVLHEEQRKANHDRAKATFLSWKKRKDFERGLCQANIKTTWNAAECVGSIKPTPSLPGYCSVWSCDEELAEQITAKVQRPS